MTAKRSETIIVQLACWQVKQFVGRPAACARTTVKILYFRALLSDHNRVNPVSLDVQVSEVAMMIMMVMMKSDWQR